MKKIWLVPVGIILLVLSFATVFADTITIRPNAVGAYNEWKNVWCPDGKEYMCIDETNPSTQDYVYARHSRKRQTFRFQDTELPESAQINSITIYYYAQRYNGYRFLMRPMLRINNRNYYGPPIKLRKDYLQISYEHEKSPATSEPWTIDEINNLEAGMFSFMMAYGARVAQMYIVVDYDLEEMPDSCSETDGGDVINIFGIISGILNGETYSYADYCTDNNNIKEYFCMGNYKQSRYQSCGQDSYGENYCLQNKVYRDYTNYFCSNGKCDSIFTPQFIKECEYECENGECVEEEPNGGYIGISLPAGFRPFSDNSPWNTPIPENPTLNPNSDAIINNLMVKLHQANSPVIRFQYKKWSVPVHIIDYSQSPKQDIATTKPNEGLYFTIDPDQDGIAENIPVPEGIWADSENDGHMVLLDLEARKTWDFSKAYKDNVGQWHASIIDVWDSDGPGYRGPFVSPRWWRSGARGSGVPLVAGLIGLKEIEAGNIPHALAISTPINMKGLTQGEHRVCSPVASRTDGDYFGGNNLLEGARLQLNPDLNLESLDLSPAAMTIARALQKYGAYDVDNAPLLTIYLENLDTNGGAWNNYKPELYDLYKIPVTEFRVLDCNEVST